MSCELYCETGGIEEKSVISLKILEYTNQDSSKDRISKREAHLNNILKKYINNIRHEIIHDYFDSYCSILIHFF